MYYVMISVTKTKRIVYVGGLEYTSLNTHRVYWPLLHLLLIMYYVMISVTKTKRIVYAEVRNAPL